MCTCVSYRTRDHYFGRNLDLEFSYQESVTITPRNYPLPFRKKETIASHYALIGMAFVQDGYPLYYDATNEVGLSMAGLNFPHYAHFEKPIEDGKDNIAPFEFIPWILSQCKSVKEAKNLLSHLRLSDIAYSSSLPITPLHWMISDKEESIVVESVKEGLKVYENPVGVMTNNPPFPIQLFRLNDYRYSLRKAGRTVSRRKSIWKSTAVAWVESAYPEIYPPVPVSSVSLLRNSIPSLAKRKALR